MKHKYFKNVTTLELISDKCTGCGKCSEVCPHNVFRLTEGKAEIIDKDLCMECGACSINCPFNAIRVKQGVGCAAYILNGKCSDDSNCGDSSSGGGCC